MKSFKLVFIIASFCTTALYCQNKQLLYDFQEIPQALLLNPGMQTSFDWYGGVPLISGISAQGAISGITVNDLFANDGLDINDKVRDRLIFGMSQRDDFSSINQIEIFNGGFRNKNNPDLFYSFGMYLETDVINYWPKDLAILAYEGNANQLGRRFDLSHLKTRGDVLNVMHFGVNKQWNRNLTVGARGKIYSGILNFKSSNNDGYFLTDVGQNNLLSNTLVADMMLRTSGFEALSDAADVGGKELAKTLVKRGLFGGDLGLGLDLGFTYNLNSQTLITGSILDLGFIYHSSDIRTFTLDGRARNEGVEIILPDALVDPNADFWQELVDEIEALIPFEENNKGYLTFRPTKLYGSYRYNWGLPNTEIEDCDCDISAGNRNQRFRYLNSVGAQLFVINRPRGPQAALTAFYQRRLGNVLALKSTYTIDKYSFSNIGLGFSLQAGPVNFYLMADNLLAYRNLADTHYASLQLGLNILSWGQN